MVYPSKSWHLMCYQYLKWSTIKEDEKWDSVYEFIPSKIVIKERMLNSVGEICLKNYSKIK